MKSRGMIMTKDMRKLVEEGYGKIDYTKAYRIDPEPNEMEEYFLKKLTELIPKHSNVLDLGSGCGVPYDRYLAGQGFDITGIDVTQKHINLAKQNVPEAKYIKGDFSKIDLEKEKYHAIVSFYAIFHIPREEHKALFIRMNDLLKKDGIILVTLGTSNSEYGFDEDWFGAPMAWSSHDPEMAKQIIIGSGFKILEAAFEGEPGDNEYHFWVMAQKK